MLLDWDNTLISSESMMHMILDDVMDEMGINKSEVYDSVTFVQAIHLSARNAFPRIFGDRWEEVYRQYQERFRKMHLEYISLLPGVIDLLEHLSAKGITLSIVSNKDGGQKFFGPAQQANNELVPSVIGLSHFVQICL